MNEKWRIGTSIRPANQLNGRPVGKNAEGDRPTGSRLIAMSATLGLQVSPESPHRYETNS